MRKREARWHEGYQSYNDMKWTRLMNMFNRVSEECTPVMDISLTKRSNGGQWDLTGYEEYKEDTPSSVGQHGCGCSPFDERCHFFEYAQYKFAGFEFVGYTPEFLNYEQVNAIAAAARGDMTSVRQDTIDYLCSYDYLKKRRGYYVPTIMISLASEHKKCRDIQDTIEWQEVCGILTTYYNLCKKIIEDEVPSFLLFKSF